ncbi:MAG: DUF4870 domain-containing protein [Candidatus Obscuribacter sp.]|nr:DUF4870 domain-containing protein [Candidatus Obscuribacter sp.]MBP6350936.1 DUF4870 domain-containing protein [Candidatus Obscuribacter sp.]MBP6595750.1 DUF4870 domain-containing protein [Candidatus Obscuribacter sp.]
MPNQPNSPSSEECTLAMMCHIIALVATSCLLNWLVPIVIMAASNSPFVKQQAKESLNFQISVILWALVSWLLCLIVIGIPMLIAVAIAAIVLPIIAAVKVSDGISYRYPLTLRLFK